MLRFIPTMAMVALTIAVASPSAQAHNPLPPKPVKAAIYQVFGPEYYWQAIKVAWCESRYSTRAQNGQYLGLFQMGSSERRLYGHGSTAKAQAEAAHRYFVRSGRDWSPWSCKPY